MAIKLLDVHEALETIVPGSSKNVTESTKIEDLPIDSLDTFQVYAELEEKTGTTVTDEAYEGIVSVQHILDYFNAR